MIRKWYEVSCDSCGSAEHFGGSLESAKKQATEVGWIIVGRLTFCTIECQQRRQGKENNVHESSIGPIKDEAS